MGEQLVQSTLQHSLNAAYQVVNLSNQDQSWHQKKPASNFKSHNEAINANCYCQTLQKLLPWSRRDIRVSTHWWHLSAAQQYPFPTGQLSSWPTLCQAQAGTQTFSIQPNLLPHHFHIFGLLKKTLKAVTFMSDNNVPEPVLEWLTQQPKEFSPVRIRHLVDNSDFV
jgi:hypothetical protein